MVSPAIIIVVGCVATALAGMSMGVASFGYGLVAVPILITVLGPKIAVPAIGAHTTITSLVLVWKLWKQVQLRRMLPLTLAAILMVPFGTYLLLVLEPRTLKVIIGVVITLAALAMLLGFRRPVRSEGLASVLVGLASGALNSTVGTGGPPIILFFANQGMEKALFRANLSAFFATINVVRMISYLIGGLFTPDVLKYTALLLPTGALGLYAGIKLAPVLREKAFRRVVLAVALLSGLLGMLSGLGFL